ncbi:MAG: hypothetical protein GXP63_01530 [DPANN group archaeon]|nr:hypothetical protein [DPANN group archaeon]
MAKLKLEFSPYTYTRVQVMRTKLFKKQDYDRLLKMTFAEIADYLGKTNYRTEIEKLGLTYAGADLIEYALNLNYKNEIDKIKRISGPSLREAFETYLLREDFHTLKILLRGLSSGIELTDKILSQLTRGVGRLKKQKIEHMRGAKTAYELLQRSGLVNLKMFKDLQGQSRFDLNSVENRLDHAYYGKVLAFTGQLTKQGKLYADFLKNEIDIQNILTIAKFVRLGRPAEEIRRHIIPAGNILSVHRLERMAASPRFEDIHQWLRHTPYHALVSAFIKGESSLLFFETALYRQMLQKSIKLMHLHPLSVNTIIGFTLLKEIEVKNLKTLVKGSQLGVDPEQIEEALVL